MIVAVAHDLVDSSRYGGSCTGRSIYTRSSRFGVPGTFRTFFKKCQRAGRSSSGALLGVRVGELLGLQWKDIDWDAKTITFGKSFWRGRLQDSTKTGRQHVRH
jgi:integrase